MSQLLYAYVRKPSTNPGFREIECDGGLRLRFGDEYKFSSEVVADTGDISGYPSWPLDGRLEFSSEAGDFFTGDDVPGSSGRLKGIVLHDILSRVRVPSDLEAAVRESFNEGSVSEEDMPEIIACCRPALNPWLEEGGSPKTWMRSATRWTSLTATGKSTARTVW